MTSQIVPMIEPPLVSGRMPLLDVASFLRGEAGALEHLAGQLRYALEQVGFYLLTGHGVSPELIDATVEQARRFHAQPLIEKQSIKVNFHNIGYLGLGESHQRKANVTVNLKPNQNEALILRRERTPDDPDVISGKQFRGMNQWPANLPGFREQVLAYMSAMETLGRRLMPIYAVALGLPADWFAAAFEKPYWVLRMSHYPPALARQPDEFGIAPHTDGAFMTFLPANPIPGLAVRMTDGTWFDVPYVEGAFTVNSGDVLGQWTNDRFLSTPHRAVNSGEDDRYAIPFFFDPHPDTMIAPLPTCVDAEHPPKYEPAPLDTYMFRLAGNYAHLRAPGA